MLFSGVTTLQTRRKVFALHPIPFIEANDPNKRKRTQSGIKSGQSGSPPNTQLRVRKDEVGQD